MNQNYTFSVLCILLFGLTVSGACADPTATLKKTPTPQTVTIGGIKCPAYPEGYHELLADIKKIETQIKSLEDGNSTGNSTDVVFPEQKQLEAEKTQLEAKIKEVKEELDKLASEKERIDDTYKKSWEVLSKDVQDKLMAQIKENPNLKVADVKDLCPKEVSYRDFAKILKDGKIIVFPLQKWENKNLEYEKLLDKLNKLNEQIKAKHDDELKKNEQKREDTIKTLQNKLVNANEYWKIKIGCFECQILYQILSKHPDFNKPEAPFPLDDFIEPISEMEQYILHLANEKEKVIVESTEPEKGMFEFAEQIWQLSRPCFLETKSAHIALQCWTAYMKGNYEEAEKYAGKGFKEIIQNSKSNPEQRIYPISPNFCGILICGAENPNKLSNTTEPQDRPIDSFAIVVEKDSRIKEEYGMLYLFKIQELEALKNYESNTILDPKKKDNRPNGFMILEIYKTPNGSYEVEHSPFSIK